MGNVLKEKASYGPEVKYKKGLDELLEALADYQEPQDAQNNPLKVLYEAVTKPDGKRILDLGSGWEKESVDAHMMSGGNANWISVNPMLAFPEHNARVASQIEEQFWSVAVDSAKRQGYGRKALAAESVNLPFKEDSFNVVLASWSVPTVLEEQIKNTTSEVEYQALRDRLSQLLPDTCSEVARVLKRGGSAIVFPVRDMDLIKIMINELDNYGEWEHQISEAPDKTNYVVDTDNPVNYLLMSTRL